MRTVSSAVTQALNQQNMQFFFLVDMDIRAAIAPNGYYLTSLPSDVVGAPTLLGSSSTASYTAHVLISVDPPRVSQIVDRNTYKILLSDETGGLKQYLDYGLTGTPVAVRVGFYDNTTGMPDLTASNLITVYRGMIDTYGVSNDFQSRTVALECSSPVADLDFIRSQFTSKASVQLIDSADKSYDQVLDGSGQLKFKWGKA